MIKVRGKNITLRTVELDDAEFIVKVRNNKLKNQYLSSVDNSVIKQKEWLKEYLHREKEGLEYYFIIESNKGKSLGLVRLYDITEKSFCWGSWIIIDEAPRTTAIESALLVYEFGFNKLDFSFSHFDVRKENLRVIAFHKRFGATIVAEDELNYYFNYKKSEYLIIKQKYKRYLL